MIKFLKKQFKESKNFKKLIMMNSREFQNHLEGNILKLLLKLKEKDTQKIT